MAVEKDFINNNENAIEYLSGEHYITVSFTDRKMINRVKKLYSERDRSSSDAEPRKHVSLMSNFD